MHMYKYMHVYVHICMYTCRMYMYMYAHMYIQMYMYMYVEAWYVCVPFYIKYAKRGALHLPRAMCSAHGNTMHPKLQITIRRSWWQIYTCIYIYIYIYV